MADVLRTVERFDDPQASLGGRAPRETPVLVAQSE
jgi:hypothetical protein